MGDRVAGSITPIKVSCRGGLERVPDYLPCPIDLKIKNLPINRPLARSIRTFTRVQTHRMQRSSSLSNNTVSP